MQVSESWSGMQLSVCNRDDQLGWLTKNGWLTWPWPAFLLNTTLHLSSTTFRLSHQRKKASIYIFPLACRTSVGFNMSTKEPISKISYKTSTYFHWKNCYAHANEVLLPENVLVFSGIRCIFGVLCLLSWRSKRSAGKIRRRFYWFDWSQHPLYLPWHSLSRLIPPSKAETLRSWSFPYSGWSR